MQVLVRLRSQGRYDWKNEIYDLAFIPRVGEYITLGAEAPWHVVQLVLHTPYHQTSAAELYAVQVDADAEKHRAFHGKG